MHTRVSERVHSSHSLNCGVIETGIKSLVRVLFESTLRYQTELYLATNHITAQGDAAGNYEQYTETKGMFCPYSSEPIVPSSNRLIAAGPPLPGFTLSFVPLKLPSFFDAK